jgi:hypothetical protein
MNRARPLQFAKRGSDRRASDRRVRWTYQRDRDVLFCELSAGERGVAVRAWGTQGSPRLHREHTSVLDAVHDQLAFEQVWMAGGWRLQNFDRSID